MKRKKKKSQIVIDIILSILGLIWIFPVLFTILGSMKERVEYNISNFWDLPKGFNFLQNLHSVNSRINLYDGMLNSFIYAFTGALLAILIALLSAFSISHLNIKYRMFWFLLIYSGTIFPFQIYLIPVFRGFISTGLYDSRLGMILFYTAMCIPFSMFVLRNFFLGISNEIVEAARMDGASNLRILIRIFVPMAVAPLSVVFLAQYSWIWNDLMFGLTFTKSASIRPVMATVSMIGTGNTPELLVASMIASIPTIVLFVLLQKKFEAGFTYQGK